MASLCNSTNCNTTSSKFCSVCNKNLCQKCGEKHGRMAKTKSHILEDICLGLPKAGGSHSVICEICLEDNSDEYCNECKQYLCHACRVMHDDDDDNKSHNFMKSSDKIKTCSDHEGKVLQFYCETCKTLICELCISANHENHNILKGKKREDKTETDADSSPPCTTTNRIELEKYQNLTVKRWSLGREAQLGQLYNINKDVFLEESIITVESTESDVKINKLDYKPEMKQFDPLSLQSCFNVFGLSSQEKLNVLLGSLKPKGHAAFLAAEKLRSYKCKTAGFAIRKETKEQMLQWIPEYVFAKKFMKQTTDETIQATHFVVGIEWGEIAAVIGENNLNNDDDSLIASISKLAIATDQSKEIISCEIKNFVQQYGTTIFKNSNSALETMSTSSNKRDKIIQIFEDILSGESNENNCQTRYTLLPLDMLKNSGRREQGSTQTLSSHDDAGVIEAVIPHFEEIFNLYHRMNETYNVIDDNKACLSSRHLNDLYSNTKQLEWAEKEIKEEISAKLQGNKQMGSLNTICSKKRRYDASIIRDNFLAQAKEAMKRVELYKELKKCNMAFVAEGVTMSEIRKDLCIDTYCAFFFDVKEPGFQVCKQEFVRLSNEALAVLQDKSKHTYGDYNVYNYIAVDLELNPEMAKIEGVPQGNHICLYQQGSYISYINAEDIENDKKLNLAQYSRNSITKLQTKPMERIILTLRCPCQWDAATSVRRWSCPICRGVVYCNVEKTHFFCNCGKAPIDSYSFRCGTSAHDDFISFKQAFVRMNLASLKPVENLNILLLGETGVGKSTWINGIVNYLTHETLQDAVETKDLIALVKSSFILTDSAYKQREIVVGTKYGKDENEADVMQGVSATQRPMIYHFPYGDMNVRLIDTPGVGDTRGYNQDTENFEAILACLRRFEKLHGICILLKPNSAKLNIVFRFCISELLTHLHRDAAANIVFCFTNARSTFYRPGDTCIPLQTMLGTYRDNHGVNIETTQKTMYCLDNEAFRFLCALKQGVSFEKHERESFDNSWEISRTETRRLFEYIEALKPHELKGTLSLNDSRNIIVGLSEPMAEISKNIETNIQVVKQKKKVIKGIDNHDTDLKSKLNMTIIEIEPEVLKYPMTVCSAAKCTDIIQVGESFAKQVLYKTECHKKCSLKGIQPEIISSPALRRCWAIDQETGNCKQCGCVWDMHMHRTYRVIKKTKTIACDEIEKLIKRGATNKTLQEAAIANAEKLIKEMEESQEKLTDISAKFGSFLHKNAITPYNDAFNEYISFQIKEERDRVAHGGSDEELKILEKLQATYTKKVELLTKAMNEEHTHITPDDIYKMRDELYAMKDGDLMKSIVNILEKSKYNMGDASVVTYNETNNTKTTYTQNVRGKGFLYSVSNVASNIKQYVLGPFQGSKPRESQPKTNAFRRF